MMRISISKIISFIIAVIVITSCTKESSLIPPPTITSYSPTIDTAGGIITIKGTGFTGASVVSFNGIAASFTVINDTTLTAIAPAGTGGTIQVTAPGGTATYNGFSVVDPGLGYCDCGASYMVGRNNLIAHWTFDSTDKEDISGLTPILTGGSSSYVTGVLGKAISFTNGWLTYPATATFAGVVNTTINSNDTFKTGFTISMWAQIPAPSDTLLTNLFQLSCTAVKNYPVAGIGFRKYRDSTLQLAGGLTNIDSFGIYPSYDSAFLKTKVKDTFEWAFIAMDFNASAKQLDYYYNGALIGSAVLSKDTADGSSAIFHKSRKLAIPAPNYATIGAFESTTTFPSAPNGHQLPGFMKDGFTGALDDIRLFNKTLSATEIGLLYQYGSMGK
ncbi:IPT/TIG domain-containing protein [Ferruginibacter albus]|uniref:IPT/TIG domain-containing protein n=1 Tax=Ferruginibacter albus TaxID=2875540 RepID=UPI001CC72B85|nr:IPT/TIG domain-containing protein [Ferruginibacter albus]UAY52991.1 IPT/TIG domain-containing protein [Ferruginibacter albus]